MIVFDLEWNSGLYDRIALNEILQIGAVRLGEDGRIRDTFCAYIRPTIHRRYSPPVEELPTLELCEASQLDLPTALTAFLDWCGRESLGAWGGGDLEVLWQNANYWRMKVELPESFCDLQEAFSRTLGTDSQLALHRAVEYCGIPDVFDYHNSLHDAMYTALVTRFSSRESLEAALHHRGEPRRKRLGPGSRKLGPFESLEGMLDNRGCRLAQCPECGAKLRVSHWFGAGRGPYLSRFKCPDHGRFLLELRVPEGPELWAVTRVVRPGPAEQAALGEARKAGDFQCHASKKGTYHRRRSRRGKSQEK